MFFSSEISHFFGKIVGNFMKFCVFIVNSTFFFGGLNFANFLSQNKKNTNGNNHFDYMYHRLVLKNIDYQNNPMSH